jgi:hypothetical protein
MNLTDRDFEILEFLYQQGVATLKQLTDQFFQSAGSARVRIHQLIKNGYLDSRSLTELKTVSRSSYLMEHNSEIFGSRKDLHKYRVYSLGNRFKKSLYNTSSLIEPIMWKHQIQLNRIIKALKQSFPDAIYISDPEVRKRSETFTIAREEAIPDLVVQTKTLNIAIELERNQKSDLRYYSRFLFYKNSSYTHVIYFCENDVIFGEVAEQASSFFKVGVVLLISPHKVYQKSKGYHSILDFLS